MRSFIIFTFCFFLYSNASSQQPDTPIAAELNMQQLSRLGYSATAHAVGFDNRYEGVKGSPYAYDDWLLGMVQVTELTAIPGGVRLNIDGLKSEVHVQMPGGIIALQNDKFQFAILETPFGPVKYKTFRKSKIMGSGEGKMLCEVLLDTEAYGLLKDPKVTFKKADYKGAYSADVRYDEYIKSPIYYLRTGKKYQKIKLKKKAIQKIIPEIRRTSDWKGTELTERKFVELLIVLADENLNPKQAN